MYHDPLDFLDGDVPSSHDPAIASLRAEQQFVDALLRARRTPLATQELTIASIMKQIDEPKQTTLSWSRAQNSQHRPLMVLAASLLVGLLLWPALFSEPLPEAHASLARGAELLVDTVDRRFSVELSTRGKSGSESRQDLVLTMRPGKRFLVSGPLELGPIHFASMQFGCDGKEFWFHAPDADGAFAEIRRAGPLEEAPSVLRGIGNVLDMGLLDMRAFVSRLPEAFQLRTVKRSTDAQGRMLVHIEATGGSARPGFHLQRAEVLCDEVTGAIVQLGVEADDGLGSSHRLRFVDEGPQPVYESVYAKPW